MSDKTLFRIVYPQNKSESAQCDDAAVPVVLMLGWSGCTDKHLEKYSDIYKERCIIIRSFAPVSQLFFQRGKLSSLAASLLSAIKQLQLTTHPIFVHFFSNGGGGVYARIMDQLQMPAYSDIKISGVIIDSAPAEHKISVAIKALSASLKVNAFLKYFLISIFLLFVIMGKLVDSVKNLAGIRSSESIVEIITSDNSRCPQLFLYSKCDELVNYLTVEKVIQARVEAGVDVRSICWSDSPHVLHLRMHREAYITQCLQFLDHCLES